MYVAVIGIGHAAESGDPPIGWAASWRLRTIPPHLEGNAPTLNTGLANYPATGGDEGRETLLGNRNRDQAPGSGRRHGRDWSVMPHAWRPLGQK